MYNFFLTTRLFWYAGVFGETGFGCYIHLGSFSNQLRYQLHVFGVFPSCLQLESPVVGGMLHD
jgi:hypothetical protein